tara:strand:- start:742 stop:1992 length:1251 start_codon:yes stop_codon:yes gene_type:complete
MFKLNSKRNKNYVFGAIDIGSSKISCLVIKQNKENYQILGIGQQISNGIYAGTVTNITDLEISIGKAVASAEKMAGYSIKDVIVVISGGEQYSEIYTSEQLIYGKEVNQQDINKLVKSCFDKASKKGSFILHAIPVQFNIDGSSPIKDPRGMIANELVSKVNICFIRETALSNIAKVVENNHLKINKFISASFASGLGCLMQEEMDLGCLLFDFGCSTTSVGVFYENRMIYNFTIPMGGLTITKDIASGLSISMQHAEKIKIINSSLINSSFNADEKISIEVIGDENNQTQFVSKNILNEIVFARMNEIIELIKNNLEKNFYTRFPTPKVVLTGGGSQLVGLEDLINKYISKNVRIGKPIRISGLADAAYNPSFSAVIGSLFTNSLKKNTFFSHKENINNKNFSIYGLYNWFEKNL